MLTSYFASDFAWANKAAPYFNHTAHHEAARVAVQVLLKNWIQALDTWDGIFPSWQQSGPLADGSTGSERSTLTETKVMCGAAIEVNSLREGRGRETGIKTASGR